ncbi:arsenate reductase (glutaredoxin) [Nitrogeniibacter aestuarii]|uniref:arsenate reductase (glutaredoxin) n=1 Tax=Nitrogeniibacter aestuarii TaxID=2815343 RepID=UPI001D10E97B|nr:arsenate reductase (glutaredoxin) [Nitrogeniibacter aestuarii]
MAETITFYHNPRCSKSRNALALLEEKGVTPDVVLYLETPPDRVTLTDIIAKLGISPHDLIRTGEDIYKAEYKGKEFDDSGWIDAMLAHPKLIERPIAVRGHRAIIGRPPENVLTLLD